MCVLTFGLHHEVLCAVLSVVLSWPFRKQFGFVVCMRVFVLGHEVLSLVLSWSSGRQLSFAAVVCVLTFVLHHEVLCAVLSVVLSWSFGMQFGFVVGLLPFVLGHEILFVVLSWSSGRHLWLFVFVVLDRFVVRGLVLKPGRGRLETGWGGRTWATEAEGKRGQAKIRNAVVLEA